MQIEPIMTFMKAMGVELCLHNFWVCLNRSLFNAMKVKNHQPKEKFGQQQLQPALLTAGWTTAVFGSFEPTLS